MTANEFVGALRTEVLDAAAQDVISLLEHPPGRQPDPGLVTLSSWFSSLPETDKQRVREVAKMASHQATFGVLAVFDGVRVIEDGADRGQLELRHIMGDVSTWLNDPSGPPLHELL
jgi:hypothetical protein